MCLHDAAGAALGLAILAIVETQGARTRRPADLSRKRERWRPSPALTRERVPEGRVRALALTGAIAALAILAWAPLECAIAYARRAALFPVLNDGSQRAGSYFIRGYHAAIDRQALPEGFRRSGGETALRVRYSGSKQLRFELIEPMPDWRGYGVLAIDLTNPAATPLKMTLRILDERSTTGRAMIASTCR